MSLGRAALAVAIGLAIGGLGHAHGQMPVDPTFKTDLLDRVVDSEGMLPARWQNREEVLAYERLVLHARQFSAAVLSKSARHDVR